MKCPTCQTENDEKRKFCWQCGAKLVSICQKCNFENAPRDMFCGECGQQLPLPAKQTLKELTFDEKLAKIQKYLPGGLTEKILSQRDRIEGERKQVTVFGAHWSISTPLPLPREIDCLETLPKARDIQKRIIGARLTLAG